jgi:glycine hydroxymethyltransferase
VAAPIRSFPPSLADADPEIAPLSAPIELELGRQRDEIELIASENIVSRAVLEAQGSVMTNKYAEGYPGRRYYGGCQFVDIAEKAGDRARLQAVRLPLRQRAAQFRQPGQSGRVPGADAAGRCTFMGLDLAAGGHLTHGSPVNMSGAGSSRFPMASIRETQTHRHGSRSRRSPRAQAEADHRRRLGLCAALGFRALRAICDAVGAYFVVDIAHFAGLVAGGAHPSPFPHAHVVTTTTHKTLARPARRHDPDQRRRIAKKINSAIFPGLQGGPLMHVIAAKAVAFHEALRRSSRNTLMPWSPTPRRSRRRSLEGGYAIVSGGTDNHLMLVDLRPRV